MALGKLTYWPKLSNITNLVLAGDGKPTPQNLHKLIILIALYPILKSPIFVIAYSLTKKTKDSNPPQHEVWKVLNNQHS